MNEIQKILNVVWAFVPKREVVVMTFFDAANGQPISIEEIPANSAFETWDELVGRVSYSAKDVCDAKNAILESCEYFKEIEERFRVEPQQKEQR